jgi:Holliday junction resolvase-like predicted endonuclease
MAENKYQSKLIKKIKNLLPGCEVLKNDSGYKQGILDLTILYGKRWAMLEVKDHAKAKEQPNQGYYLRKFAKMSFAAKIYPENEEEVLTALQKALSPRRATRVSKS